MSDVDEQITATIVASGDLGATVSTTTQGLKANIDSEGNLVANRLSIGPDTPIDGLSDVTIVHPIKDNSFLQYDQNSNAWNNSLDSIEETVDKRKGETYDFVKTFGYSSDNIGLGFLMSNENNLFSSNNPNVFLSIPAPKGGYSKRARLRIRFHYSYNTSSITNFPINETPQFVVENSIQFNQPSTAPISFTVADAQFATAYSAFTGARDIYVTGNHLEKISTLMSRVALTTTGSGSQVQVIGARYQGPSSFQSDSLEQDYTIITVFDSQSQITVGDTIYLSNSNFIDSNFVQFITPYQKSEYLTIPQVDEFFNTNVTPAQILRTVKNSGRWEYEVDIILPATSTQRNLTIRTRKASDSVSFLKDSGNHPNLTGQMNLYIHKITGTVENL